VSALRCAIVAVSAASCVLRAQDSAGFAPPARCATVPAAAAEPVPVAAHDSTHKASRSRASADRMGRKYGDTVRAAPPLPEILPRSVLPGCRIIAFYGNPMSKRMGILGALPADSMLAHLDRQAAQYAALDTTRPVVRALQLVTPVAQAAPGHDGKYRLRMRDSTIDHFAQLAERANGLLILDMQVGKSTVGAELEPLMPFLARARVHLALDAEFSIKRKDKRPGQVVGTLDAADINLVIDSLAALVTRLDLPPKVLIVHRYTIPMVTHSARIKIDPRVQVVLDMDGNGIPSDKFGSYGAYVHDRPVEFPGIKLFYKQDKPMLTVMQVLGLDPVPLYVQYQ
jgi:hypothetical protein